MLPDEQVAVKARLGAAHQKLLEMFPEGETDCICLQTLRQIAIVQADLQCAAVSLLRCQLRTSLLNMMNPDLAYPDEEEKKFIEQYQIWLKFSL